MAASSLTASAAAPDSGAAEADALPDAAAVAALLAPVAAFRQNPRQARTRAALRRLAANPPQLLLLEGGGAEERLQAVHYWMALLNCRAPQASSEAPCLSCRECVRMIVHLHRDCFFLDGTAASIKIGEVREIRSQLGEAPREARRRMVIFREAQAMGEAAANVLLKSFEEPLPQTCFALLAPQRERLLPTLVSRSLVLTLPWPGDPPKEDRLVAWEAALCVFLANGQGLFERSGARGAVDIALAQAIIGLCRRALMARISAAAPPAEGLERLLAALSPQSLRFLDEALAESQDSLVFGVNPTLVLEWLATRMYLLVSRGAGSLA
ncbi:MAG: DNA polymerase III subunit delta' [Deltaproteobacteria bacterium]|jgi:DNA polymerase-3 subunit delta'|nr:DNA polymerase III subunit delta' [Deltaproteobacteria bacterium]